ncbi:MAG: hypothetical protein ACXADO_00625 [Candidatus Thorarchaeota archaeon]|jgi:hypothetical protein
MSESLVVHCEDCGATKRFEGKDTVAIIKEMNRSDWVDTYDPDEWERLPHGHITGFCPEHANNEGE